MDRWRFLQSLAASTVAFNTLSSLALEAPVAFQDTVSSDKAPVELCFLSAYEIVVFGDVLAKDRFIVQTRHRTAHIQNGKMLKVEYGYSYPAYSKGARNRSRKSSIEGCWSSPNTGTDSMKEY